MNIKRIVLIIVFWGVFISPFLINVPQVKALTNEELLVQIKALQEQIAQLQKQLQSPEEEVAWCYDFNVNLRIQDSGDEVSALNNALLKEGFDVDYTLSSPSSYFSEKTASAVVGFQEKYADDVLAIYGLTNGTGFVGKTTRIKLNKLYGCDGIPSTEKPSLKIVSPNGGEKWEIGSTYDISWKARGLKKITISVWASTSPAVDASVGYSAFSIAPGLLDATLEKYKWTINTKDIGLDTSKYQYYKINIDGYTEIPDGLPGNVGMRDISNDYFSIVTQEEIPTTCHTSTLWSWNYASLNCKGDAGEGDCDRDSDCSTGYCALNVGAKYGQVSSMDVCEEKTTILYKTDFDGAKLYGYLYKSEDNGETWKEILHQYKGKIIYATDSKNLDIIYAGDANGNLMAENMDIDLLKSIDAGEHWTDISKGITGEGNTLYGIDSLEVDSNNSDIVKITVSLQSGNVDLKSTDGGSTWEKESDIHLITVLTPNGGEKLVSGQTYNISWTSKGMQKINIGIVGGQVVGPYTIGDYIVSNIDASLGKYSWTISSDYIIGNYYRIFIGELTLESSGQFKVIPGQNINIYDNSDGYFSIVEKTTALWDWNHCTANSPCDAGEGDCDRNSDCNTGYCAQNVGTKYGQVSTMDVCEEKQAITCNNTDWFGSGDENHKKRLTDKGTCADSTGSHTDVCIDDNMLRDYICEPLLQDPKSCGYTTYSCKAYGFTGCSDGICVQEKSITLTSPNGEEKWVRENIYDITWNFSGDISKINIEIWKASLGSGGLSYIAKDIDNTGSYSWDTTQPFVFVPYSLSKLIEGDDYKIYVRDSSNSSIFDRSDNYFSIIEAEESITIISPNGGEKWKVGETHDILWEAGGVETVYARIIHGEDKMGVEIISGILGSLGKYSWTIGQEIMSSRDDYQISIFGENTLGQVISDKSNNYFSIVEETTTTCHTSDLWSWNYVSLNCKGNAGEGDCDRNSDCNTGYCAQNVGTKYGQVSTMDVCEEKQAITCNNTDWFGSGDENHKKRLTDKGTCADSTGSHTDVCIDDNMLRDYICEPLLQDPKSCGYTTYSCKAYGFTGCSNGLCIIADNPNEGMTIAPTPRLNNIAEQLASISETISNLLENVEELLK